MALVDTLVRHAWHQVGCKCGWVNPISWDADPPDAERAYAEHVAEILTETKEAQKARVLSLAQAREQRREEQARKQAEENAFADRVQEAVDQGHSLRQAMQIAAHPPTAEIAAVRTSDAQVGIAMHAIIRYYDEQGHVTDPASVDFQALRAGIDALSEYPALRTRRRRPQRLISQLRKTEFVSPDVAELMKRAADFIDSEYPQGSTTRDGVRFDPNRPEPPFPPDYGPFGMTDTCAHCGSPIYRNYGWHHSNATPACSTPEPKETPE